MGGNINKVILVGRLGAEVELRTAKSGASVARFPLATSFGSGERQETDWHRVTVFGRTAERCAAWLQKGQLCYLEGRVSYRRFEKDDQVRYFTDIIAHKVEFLQRKGAGGSSKEQDHGGDNVSGVSPVAEQVPF